MYVWNVQNGVYDQTGGLIAYLVLFREHLVSEDT